MTTPTMHSCELTLASTVSAVVHVDGATLLDSRTGRLFACNATGALVWSGLERGRTLEEIAEQIARTHATSKDVARGDVDTFIGSLLRHALLDWRTNP